MLYQVSVIVTTGFCSVTSANKEEVFDRFGLDAINNLVGNTHNSVSGKTGHYRSCIGIFGESFKLKSTFYDRCEIFVLANVRDIRPTDKTGGKDIVFVSIFRLLNTVCGKQDGTGKFRHLFLLILPGGTIMAIEMVIFL